MLRKTERKETQYTQPDHRPMIPVFRRPEDHMDDEVRSVRRRYDEINPAQYLKWR